MNEDPPDLPPGDQLAGTRRKKLLASAVAVIAVAETVSLIAASGTGIALAALLFIREKVSTSAVRRKTWGNQVFSKQIRLPEERALLEERGEKTVVFELQGSLFFGTTDQLFTPPVMSSTRLPLRRAL
mgnify:CR=1 FL=1